MKALVTLLLLVVPLLAQDNYVARGRFRNLNGFRLCDEFPGGTATEKITNCLQDLNQENGAVLIPPTMETGAPSSLGSMPNATVIDFRRQYAGMLIWNNKQDPQNGAVAGLRVEISPNLAENFFPRYAPNPDAVAIYSKIDSAGRSRIWGFNVTAAVTAEQDARAESIEVDLENQGSEEPEFADREHPLRKHKSGIEIVKGYTPSRGTAALRVTTIRGNGEGWFKGIDIAGVTNVGIAIGTRAAVSGAAVNPKVGIAIGYGTVDTSLPAAIRARQSAEGDDVFIAQRGGGSGPAGTMFRAIDEKGASLFFVDGNGMTRSAAFGSTKPGAATTGTVRLTSDQVICWRNEAGNGNVCLGKTKADAIEVVKTTD